MKRNVLTKLALVLLMISVVLVGCAPQQAVQPPPTTGQPTTPPPAQQFKIGINNFGQANFFARIGRDAMMDEITKLGGQVISTVTANVPDRMRAIEDFIAQGVNAIIIQEGDINLVAPALQEARRRGIIIASMDAGIAEFVDVVVQSNNPVLGSKAAMHLMTLMGGRGEVVEIYNDLGQMIRKRRRALHAVIAEFPAAEITAGIVYAWPDFFPDVKSKMEAILQANPTPGKIRGVFASFDGAGVAAASAIREAGLQNYIVVVGIDGDPEAFKEMRRPDSPFKATVAQDPDTIARIAVRRTFDLLNGKTLATRWFHVPGILITKDNLPPGE